MFLGIDLGTSELKLLLLDDENRIVASLGEPLASNRPQPLWSEQHPADWWSALDRSMLRLRESHPGAMSAVRAIGPSGQMHGAVLLDTQGHVLRPAILWNDGRSGPQCAELEASVPSLRAVAGNLAMPGFTAPKLLWVREHEPDLFARTCRVLLPKDWLRHELTGEYASEMSDASGTLWLDVRARRWSDELLAACGLTRDHMPSLGEGNDVSGTLRAKWAARWGLRAGIPVAGGGGDNAASAVGIGAVRPNQGFVSLGTSGVIFLAGDRFRPNPEAAVHAFCHALPLRWHQMSVMLSAASALRWARELLGLPSEAALLERAASLTVSQRRRAPIFLPYLSGERTPHNDAAVRGAFTGLAATTTRAAMTAAVVDGVCHAMRDAQLALADAGSDPREADLIGGGARSPFWSQRLADTLGITLHKIADSEVGCAIGAARLGRMAAGDDLSCARKPRRLRTFEPRAAEVARHAQRHAQWQRLYPLARELAR